MMCSVSAHFWGNLKCRSLDHYLEPEISIPESTRNRNHKSLRFAVAKALSPCIKKSHSQSRRLRVTWRPEFNPQELTSHRDCVSTCYHSMRQTFPTASVSERDAAFFAYFWKLPAYNRASFQELSGDRNPSIFSKVLPYKWEAYCRTNGRCTVGFPFLQGLQARKVQ